MSMDNRNLHSKEYNVLFDSLVFSNICVHDLVYPYNTTFDKNDCNNFYENILQQGLYPSIIKYADAIISIQTNYEYEYENNYNGIEDLSHYDSSRFNLLYEMQHKYFGAVTEALITNLSEDIINKYILL